MNENELFELQMRARGAVRDFSVKKKTEFPPQAFQCLLCEGHPQGFVFLWSGKQPVFEGFLIDEHPYVYQDLKMAFDAFSE